MALFCRIRLGGKNGKMQCHALIGVFWNGINTLQLMLDKSIEVDKMNRGTFLNQLAKSNYNHVLLITQNWLAEEMA